MSSLKQCIMIKNEFSNNVNSTGNGSRGNSPGQYVMRYMAREQATEVLSPVRLNDASFNSDLFMRYMLRSNATEKMKHFSDSLLIDVDAYGSPYALKHRFRKMDQLSGRSFGSKGISLSHDELGNSSERIQRAFDDGHSVQKIVISFTEDYLKETNVLASDFKYKGRGSYKGSIDQLKLRQSLLNGMSKMIVMGKYADPEWVGTIQLDTAHIHAHIALVDCSFSPSRLRSDGSDRGKINTSEKKAFRKGIHFALEDMSDLKFYNRQVSLERQNVVAFVKDYAYSTINQNTSLQLLISSLPKNKQLWRYNSHDRSMKTANGFAKNIVETLFQDEPLKSGYERAMDSICDYANESKRKNKLSDREYRNLIDKGYSCLVERSVNGLYKNIAVLKSDELYMRTPMIDLQSSSDDDLKRVLKMTTNDDYRFDLTSFVLRVRGYNVRHKVHMTKASEFYKQIQMFDQLNDQNLVDTSAHVMRLYYEEELTYHMQLVDKYRTFLSFHNDYDRKNVLALTPKCRNLNKRYDDLTIKQHDDLTVKAYCYDLRDYMFECFSAGVLSYRDWSFISDYDLDSQTFGIKPVLPIYPKLKSDFLKSDDFRQIKALDVHHLGLDYYNQSDIRIDSFNALNFAQAFEDRRYVCELANHYVQNTNQELNLLSESMLDVELMEPIVNKAVNEGLISVVLLDDIVGVDIRQLYTISADHSLDVLKDINEALFDESMEQMLLQQSDNDDDQLETIVDSDYDLRMR